MRRLVDISKRFVRMQPRTTPFAAMAWHARAGSVPFIRDRILGAEPVALRKAAAPD